MIRTHGGNRTSTSVRYALIAASLAALVTYPARARADASSTSSSGNSVSTQSTSSSSQTGPKSGPTSSGTHDVMTDADLGDVAGHISATYFGIFYGPSVTKPTSYQPTEHGWVDPDRPVMMKNFLGLGYNLTDHIRITPTAYWEWMPTAGGGYSIQDPFVRISDDSIFSTDEFNLYGDVRYYAPLSDFSKYADINGSAQAVQVLTYLPESSRWLFGLWGSERVYFYGQNGYGNDFELYVGPNINYQITPTLQLTLLYETNLAHVYGTNPSTMEGDGTDFQPGLSWDITPNINLHPFLSFYPSDPNLQNTSFGALLYLQAF